MHNRRNILLTIVGMYIYPSSYFGQSFQQVDRMVSGHCDVWLTWQTTEQPGSSYHSPPCQDARGEFVLLREEAAPADVCSTPPETLRHHQTSATASYFRSQLSLTDTLILKSAHMGRAPTFLRSRLQWPRRLERVWGSCTDLLKWDLVESGSVLHQSTVCRQEAVCLLSLDLNAVKWQS